MAEENWTAAEKRTVRLLVDASLVKDNISATLTMMRVKIRAITLAFTTTWLQSKITYWKSVAWMKRNLTACGLSISRKAKVKCSRYRPGVAQRVGRDIALLFHDRGTRKRWMVSSTPRPHFTPWERPDTHFTGGLMGPRAGLDGRKISSPPGSDPGPSSQ